MRTVEKRRKERTSSTFQVVVSSACIVLYSGFRMLNYKSPLIAGQKEMEKNKGRY